ncbi:Translocation protein Sec62, ascomycota [Lasallia pustulata]|uniref:Translocation protein SEC62 n=1 Tax=Lasallia pustulata TaxID=136370 RepID=A0A1W5CVH0_9LECA|nr:Translocation protein Sec62, ascomycota [Lasallia pustulata]
MNGTPAPGQQPTPQQMAAMQQQMALEAQRRGMTPQQFQLWQRQQLEAEAKKAGMTLEQYINQLKQQAFQTHQRQQQQLAQQQAAAAQQPGGPAQQTQQVPINPGTPDPKALAVAKWLRGQDLKSRTCILNGQRKDMIKGHAHGPPAKAQKRVKGLWTVRIEQQQDVKPELHYVWLYEGSQLRQKLYACAALLVIMAVVMFPLWPIRLRIGVWYLSMGMMGLIALFFAMAIFRLLLFCVTVFAVPPGLWLYPNLFEDVGFFDSFRPVWGWQEEKNKKRKSSKKHAAADDAKPQTADGNTPSAPLSVAKTTTTMTTGAADGKAGRRRDLAPRIEEVEED